MKVTKCWLMTGMFISLAINSHSDQILPTVLLWQHQNLLISRGAHISASHAQVLIKCVPDVSTQPTLLEIPSPVVGYKIHLIDDDNKENDHKCKCMKVC
jgi:hypothetical protein